MPRSMCVASFVLVQQSTGVYTVVQLPTTAFHVLGTHIDSKTNVLHGPEVWDVSYTD